MIRLRWEILKRGFVRIHVYPFGEYWIVEKMTTWQSFFNDLKLFGWRVAIHNFYLSLTIWPGRAGKVVQFPKRINEQDDEVKQ